MAKNKKPLPILEKITITDIAAEGKAIAKVNDIVVFVPFVVPGDVVDLQVTRKKSSFMEARPIHILKIELMQFVNILAFVEVVNGKFYHTQNKSAINKNR